MTDAREAAERIVRLRDTQSIIQGAEIVATAYLDLLSQPGEEEVKRVVARLSAMGLVVVPEKVIEDARAVLEWDGGHRSKGYDASKSYDARERLHAHFTASPKVQP